MIVVSPAIPADAPALLALHRAVLAEGDWFVTEPDELTADEHARAQLVRDCSASDNSLMHVARRGPRVLGVVQVAGGVLRRTRHLGRVEIMVAKEARGRGVGRRLMESAIHEAKRAGVLQKLELQVMAHNTAAVALYLALGFVEEGRRHAQYRFPDGSFRDEVVMGLPLYRAPV